jgi:hypothetical protein
MERAQTRLARKVDLLMALTQKETDAFLDLVDSIDEAFRDAAAPLVAEVQAKLDAALAEDTIDQAEVDRLTLVLSTAEDDTIAAIADVKAHVQTLGPAPKPAPEPTPEPMPFEEPPVADA